MDGLKFVDLVANALDGRVDLIGAARDGLEVLVEDSIEVLDCHTDLLNVLADQDDVLGFSLDVLDLAELPTVDGALRLDLHLGL